MILLKNCILKRKGFILEIDEFKIEEGKNYLIIGPSGGGKSTLLKILCGLQKDFKGELIYKDLPKKNPIIYLSQTLSLWDHLSVRAHIDFILNDAKSLKPNPKSIKYLKYFEIEDKKDFFIDELSQGQKQRLALARALATKAKYIFLDEAFSNIDKVLAHSLLKRLYRIQKEEGFSLVEVSHYTYDINESVDIYVVYKGRILQKGKLKEIKKDPKNEWVKKWLELL